MANYVLADAIAPRGVCRLGAIENVPDWAEMQKGERQKDFPSDAVFRMSKNFPKDVKLADVLFNMNSFLVASERFVETLQAANMLTRNDLHPVGILNHKGRREKADYFIVHQYDFPRCVDQKKTVGEKSGVNPNEYDLLETLVLDEKKIDKNLALFRPLEYNQRPFFRRDASELIAKAGMTGIFFFEIDQYNRF